MSECLRQYSSTVTPCVHDMQSAVSALQHIRGGGHPIVLGFEEQYSPTVTFAVHDRQLAVIPMQHTLGVCGGGCEGCGSEAAASKITAQRKMSVLPILQNGNAFKTRFSVSFLFEHDHEGQVELTSLKSVQKQSEPPLDAIQLQNRFQNICYNLL